MNMYFGLLTNMFGHFTNTFVLLTNSVRFKLNNICIRLTNHFGHMNKILALISADISAVRSKFACSRKFEWRTSDSERKQNIIIEYRGQGPGANMHHTNLIRSQSHFTHFCHWIELALLL